MNKRIFETLREKIKAADVVSFDIFDTLIVRFYRKPTDLFMHLEEISGMRGFKDARISAEMAQREAFSAKGIREVCLTDIYDKLHPSYLSLMQKEIELEIFACRRNQEMYEIYEFAQQMSKQVFIASDMYLPKDVIVKILQNSGYAKYDGLLLSSDTLRPKATGEMYEDLVAISAAPRSSILHIGDNLFTDFQVATEHGIDAYHYVPILISSGESLNPAFFSLLETSGNNSVAASILAGLIAKRTSEEPDESYWAEFGYKYCGIPALSYMRWLKDRLEEEGIGRVFFMLRDGYIFKRVFDYLYPEFETYEIYGSRTMYMLPCMDSYQDIKNHITGEFRQGLTYRRCYDRLGVYDECLFNEYEKAFPDLDDLIIEEADFRRVDDFFIGHEKWLKKIGAEKRKEIIGYFDSVHLLDGKSAIVDLGWKGSMLKSIERLCRIENRNSSIYGYYFGTHAFDSAGIRAQAFSINNGKPDNRYPYKALLDYGFLIAILELAFSAPFPSMLGGREENGNFVANYQSVCSEEQKRLDICAEILKGVLGFVHDFSEISDKYHVETSVEVSLLPLEYLSRFISRHDAWHISQVCYFPAVGNDTDCYPITRNGSVRFGICFPWPGSSNAETEAITRIKRAAEENGIQCVPIDNHGHILTNDLCLPEKLEIISHADFIISTHFETSRAVDAFYYHVLWNPPEYSLNGDYYDWVSKNYLMYDDFLIYDNGGISNHLRSILINCHRTLEKASSLLSSLPISAMLEPDLSSPKIFYCGMNWDRLVYGLSRHAGLFKLLDETGYFRIYGPDKGFDGIRHWEGYKSYQGSIPFDGFSLIKELNRCGVCLVISSDVHRRAGAVTNRAFEACAAGAVIISDDNPLMQKMFKDAALFIKYDRNNPTWTCKQIIEKYEWILSNKEEALKLARRAQEIFRKHYSLDVLLKKMVRNHPARMQAIANDLYARTEEKRVLVSYVCNTQSVWQAEKWIGRVFSNMKNQVYRTLFLVLVVDKTIAPHVTAFCKNNYAGAQVVGLELFDSRGTRVMTDGQAFTRIRNTFAHDYFMLTNANEVWFYDHVTTLVRSTEDNNAAGAYSGQIRQDCNNFRHVSFFETLSERSLTDFGNGKPHYQQLLTCPGGFIFDALCHAFLPDFLFDFIDGREHLAYAHIMLFKEKKQFVFSKRMTFLWEDMGDDWSHAVVTEEQERRFILGLTLYDRPSMSVQAGDESTTATGMKHAELVKMLSFFPIKPYLKMRYYRFRLRKLSPQSKKYEQFQKKYQDALTSYEHLLGIR